MKHCPVCHTQYSDDQNFCPTDGSALTANVVQSTPAAAAPPHAPQPVQIIQMAAPKSKTGLYVVLGLLAALAMIIGVFFYLKHAEEKSMRAQEKQEQQDQAAYEKDYAQRVTIAQLDSDLVKKALDSVSSGSSATFKDCAQTKMDLYQQRYNVWVGKQEVVPTKTQSQQNVNLAAQASINSCKKEAEGLEMGVPSFECGKATSPTELAICTNKELAQADVKLVNAARSAKFFADDTQAFNTFMKTWIKNRNNCGDNVDCIANSYKGTTATLNSQVEP